MGVGAIFISTLAIHRLPEPHNPAETQQDILATVLHPVVGFVVLVSIIIRRFPSLEETHRCSPCADGLSIPFFNAGKTIHHRTLTMTTTLGTRSRTLGGHSQAPDWLLSVRHSPSDPILPSHLSDNIPAPRAPPPAIIQGDKDSQVEINKASAVRASPTPAGGSSLDTKKVNLSDTSPSKIEGDEENRLITGAEKKTTTESSVNDIISGTSAVGGKSGSWAALVQ